jgi:hypothetical protein
MHEITWPKATLDVAIPKTPAALNNELVVEITPRFDLIREFRWHLHLELTETQVAELYQSGLVGSAVGKALAWRPGMNDWRPLLATTELKNTLTPPQSINATKLARTPRAVAPPPPLRKRLPSSPARLRASALFSNNGSLPLPPAPLPPRTTLAARTAPTTLASAAAAYVDPQVVADPDSVSITRLRTNPNAVEQSPPDDWMDDPTLQFQRPAVLKPAVADTLPAQRAQLQTSAQKVIARISASRQPLLWALVGAVGALLCVLPFANLGDSAAAAVPLAPQECVAPATAAATAPAVQKSSAPSAPARAATRSKNSDIPLVTLASLPKLTERDAERDNVTIVKRAHKPRARAKARPKTEARAPAETTAGAEADRQALGQALVAAASNASSCGNSGSARVIVTFAASGQVRGVRFGQAPADKETAGCVRRAIGRARGPAFDGEPVTVSKTISW